LEGGNRVPTIAYWPGKITPSTSAALISQVDLFASMAQMLGISLSEEDGMDSQDLYDTWCGNSKKGM
jgi:arylsulfatase A-like enzyme